MTQQISKLGVALCSGAIGVMAATSSMAADKVSGNLGVSYNSHFISYGADVWAGGTEFFGDRSTTFAFADVSIQATDDLSVYTGVWADINDNTNSAIGGTLQEVDWFIGAAYSIDAVTVSATYQAWLYAGDVEEILDFGLSYDDSALLGDWAMSPSVTWHIRTQGNGTQAEGSVLVLGVSPGFDLTETVSVSIPAGIGIFLDDDFQGGTDGGYAYSYLGASVGVPLSFISDDYGSWAMNFDLIGYTTDDDAIPGNPDETFLTGSVGLSMAF
ncbi:MAG: hypothetical protein ACFB0Z_00150 [Candidatus Phaeomarinobacter sp.]